MEVLPAQLLQLEEQKQNAFLRVYCLGRFEVENSSGKITAKEWGRDKTVQLFQFFVTSRHRRALHKEVIIDRLWEDLDGSGGDRDFKVALHGINKVLDPNRKSRSESKIIIRQGLTYEINAENIWIDSDAVEKYIEIGNDMLTDHQEIAIAAFKEALKLDHGIYFPNRLYDDWTSEERERLQVLILGAYITLAELLLDSNPIESIRLSRKALMIDKSWEDAYRIQMQGYLNKGNRPMAIKTYQKCEMVLEDEMGISPLPQTRQLFEKIKNIK